MSFTPRLFSQLTFEGFVTDNGAEYLGNGAEPVANALVELADQNDPARCFRDRTDTEGKYVIQIVETGVHGFPAGSPGAFRLSQNYPNPFNPSTVISFETPYPANIHIDIRNVCGKKVKTLLNGYQSGGSDRVAWDAADDAGKGVPAGVYIYSLSAGGVRISRKMLLMDGGSTFPAWPLKSAEPGHKLNKTLSDLYELRISGANIQTYERQNLQITGNTVLDVTVSRTATDVDGNVYQAVKIGDQWWTAENLKATRYRDGTAIPDVPNAAEWCSLPEGDGAYCDCDYRTGDALVENRLYNWYAAKRNLAPAGWHVPSADEWQTLIDHLGGEEVAGGKLKEAGTVHWPGPNEGATNESGFTALPGGGRWSMDCYFLFQGMNAYFWTSTAGEDANTAYIIGMGAYWTNTVKNEVYPGGGYSVRLVRDSSDDEGGNKDP